MARRVHAGPIPALITEPLGARASVRSTVILSADIMIIRLTTRHENGIPALSPLGERVDRDGVFISRRGPGEGVIPPIFIAAKNPRSSFRT